MLRTGIVRPGDFRETVENRGWIGKEAHDRIRAESYEAERLIKLISPY